jgi:hypothetical protein
MDQARFSVCRYGEDGIAEYVTRLVGLAKAVEIFSTCVSAGSSKRVIVTNGEVNLEWTLQGGFRRG